MGKVRRLEPELVEKIAAGEVVERPASVVKECIENAIDAGAAQIRIELADGGKEEIIVRDNGSGMPKDDAVLAVEPHTTSKLSSLKDLFEIRQLGFRGEALASIAAVSMFTLVTNDSEGLGTRVVVENGQRKVEGVGSPQGTTITVRQLFYNTPARKKFLGAGVSELKHILDIVTRYALAYPEIGFFVKSDGAEVLAAPSSPSLRNKISHLYGPEVAKNMIEVAFKGAVEVSGLIGIPAIARKTRSMENLFVNRRFVKSQLLTDALESAYKTLLFLERKPVAVLNIAIEPLMVDVNVHPTKLEVKFENPDAVFSAVHMAVKMVLEGNELLESHDGQSVLSKVLRAHEAVPFETSEQTMLLKDKPQKKQYRVLGQVARSFIVAEVADGLLLVDQHAAAERINLEMLHKTQNQAEKSQQLLQPVIVSPPKSQVPIIAAHLEHLKHIGFEIEGFGQHDFLVRQVPVVFSEVVSKQFLNSLFDELADNIKKSRKELVNENIMYVMACKASVKANDELSMQEIHELLDALFACDQSYACAHGRPTIIKFTNCDLERMFKRK